MSESADGSAQFDALARYDVVDTAAEPAFDDVVALAARICEAPMASISLVDGRRQWFKSQIGLGVAETAIDVSVCARILDQPGISVLPDLTLDPRFSDLRRDTALGRLRFYAGCPLVTADGIAIGALAVLDVQPRPDGLSDLQVMTLEVLGRQVMQLIENRRVLRERNESESQFRVLTDSMPQMIWTTRPDGFHDFYNERWYEFTGMPHGSTDGEGWNGMFHPDDRERAFAAFRHCLATGDLYEIEYRLRHHSGEYRWVLGRAVPLRDAAGQISRWFGTCTDIHAIKRTETALADSEERFRTLIEVAPQVVWFAGPDGAITYSSPHWYDYTGCDPAQGIDETWAQAVPAEHRGRLEAAWATALGAGDAYEIEIPFRRRDGAFRWFLVRAQPVRDRAGRIERWAGISIDIHERRQAEEAGDLLARELAHRIKNIFAVIASLVAVSARGDPAVRPYADALRQRLSTLALAHDYVRPHSEASRPEPLAVTIHGLLATLLDAYRDGEDEPRIAITGPDHPIGARAATAMALIVHEQATNAMKYGALSLDGGRVGIETRIMAETIEIHWRESGGPPITGAPTRRGFGTVLAERSASGQLGGEMRHDWKPEGLRSVLAVPLASLRD
ncbi:PAS domain-containing protein [Aureimonas sp. AU12]|uniref:PAS domain-containing protein n=1 Tax=Aureimonas sp. AU12 TaxID=1638161 RepID=UPI000A9F7793|nr:PAS domain-containing protein [Aureimonas sp. AU12]